MVQALPSLHGVPLTAHAPGVELVVAVTLAVGVLLDAAVVVAVELGVVAGLGLGVALPCGVALTVGLGLQLHVSALQSPGHAASLPTPLSQRSLGSLILPSPQIPGPASNGTQRSRTFARS